MQLLLTIKKLLEIKSSLRGDEYLNDGPSLSGDCHPPVQGESLDYDTDCNTTEDGVSYILNDFTILNVQDSDDGPNYEPDSNLDLDESNNEWNVTEIEKKVYGAPDQTLPCKDKFVTKVNIE